MDGYQIQLIDILIIIWYFIILLIIGLSFSSKTKTDSELFLAGKKLTWPAIGFSLFASNISSSTMIGLASLAYSFGLAAANYEWMATVILIFSALFFIPFFTENNIDTVPEFLEKRFDKVIRKYFSLFTILLTIFIDIAASLYAGSLMISVFLPSISIWQSCLVLAIIAGIYTAAGGLAAVVYTDILQSVLVLMGCSVMLFAVFGAFDFSLTQAFQGIGDQDLSFILPANDPNLPWLGTLLGLPILGFYVWIINQYIVQRVIAAKSTDHARKGALLGGFLKLFIVFLMVMPGLFAKKLFPDMENPDMVFPNLIIELLPPGVVGLLLAGMLAAIMSSLDSALNSASTLITLDFINTGKKTRSPNKLAIIGKRITLGLMIFAGLWAPLIAQFEGLFIYVQIALSYVIAPIVVVFLGAIFLNKTSAKSALFTLVSGHALCVVWAVLPISDWLNIHYTITPFFLFVFSILLLFVFNSKFPLTNSEKLHNHTWTHRPVVASEPRPWIMRFETLTIGLGILTLALLIAFW